MYFKQQELLEKTLSGDSRAKAELVCMYQPLAKKTASYFFSISGDNPCITFDDLLSEANYGFLSALETYDPSKGHAFNSYIENGMKMAIRKYLSSYSRPIRIPKYQIERMSRLDKFLSANDKNGVDICEISEKTGLSLNAIKELFEIKNSQKCFSLDQRMNDDEAFAFSNLVGCEDFTSSYEQSCLIADMGEYLMEKGKGDGYILKALTGAFGEDKRTLKQLSSELGVSVSTIRKRYNSMLSRLRMQFSVA